MLYSVYRIRISSSISNFREKIRAKYPIALEWNWLISRTYPTYFFGLYHIGDYIRFSWHRGDRVVFWCGGDILNLEGSYWKKIIPKFKARHYCENEVEKLKLASMGIQAEVKPMFYDNLSEFEPCFRSSDKPHVYLCSHPDYEEEYGVGLIEGIAYTLPEINFHIYGIDGHNTANIKYHGNVSNERFNRDIRNYQAGLRLNDFDGFSEVLAKSVLLGQWPISRLYYPHIDYAPDLTSLINLLKNLKYKIKPNSKGREYWLKRL